jgi:hypothetical protein
MVLLIAHIELKCIIVAISNVTIGDVKTTDVTNITFEGEKKILQLG